MTRISSQFFKLFQSIYLCQNRETTLEATCVDYPWDSITIDKTSEINDSERMVFGFLDKNGNRANFAKDAFLLFDFPKSASSIDSDNPR